MKPHLWRRHGNWHCGVGKTDGVRVYWWPRGVGYTPAEAYADYAKRAKEWAA